MTAAPLAIAAPLPAQRAEWDRLYAGYAAFYRVEQTPAMRDRVWGWIMDPAHEVKALVATRPDGSLAGLAHYRPFARPLMAGTGGFLDDLFVDPAARGQRVADALIEAVSAIGRQRGWGLVRWITADDNYRGRGVYDRLATRTMWVTYDRKLG
ncbi:GNAT family N-acetyltransferase [Falsiroseomonas selenitidurans]|uniref:GNAT family N-acetyltransferase n=1 Tax=Falsiroseomonas selenitidurans TaxID=2716335 RepID=A0ABX1DYC2_9PROT|nr:GNAT family N-acetyltransferase [Falsiroseomonas selenitidurans]NKC29821.1 GNAT family N-acetyltransferase [Falsiroseomonas selenitidurans]